MSARVYLRRLGLAGNVSFLFDTGADNTVVMPADAMTMGVDYAAFRTVDASESLGIGGPAPVYPERASVTFVDAGGHRLFRYDTTILIHHPTAHAMRVPSLLGRDVIDRWRTTYDKPRLQAEVVSCDGEYLVDTPGNQR